VIAKRPKRERKPTGAGAALKAQIAANAYCLRRYSVGFTGGKPRPLTLDFGKIWIVPVMLASPGYGWVGDVGLVAVDASTFQVIGATPRPEVMAAGARLERENRDALDAAFHRARKA